MSDSRVAATATSIGRRIAGALLMMTCAVGAAQYAPSALARGGHGGGHGGGHCCGGGVFFGGAIVGAAIASSYFYGPSYYSPAYYPPAYYPPPYYPPPAPTTYIEQQQYYTSPPPAPPVAAAPPQPQLSLEQRVQRLKAMCDQHLFTPEECANRREQLLREM